MNTGLSLSFWSASAACLITPCALAGLNPPGVTAAADVVGCKPEELELEKKLRLDYGISSVEAAELIIIMEDTYGLNIPVEEAVEILSTQDAIDYVMKNAA